MSMGRRKQILWLVCVAVVSFMVGLTGSRLFSAAKSKQVLDILLYGEEEESRMCAQAAIDGARPLFYALRGVLGGHVSDSPRIAPERKLLLLRFLAESEFGYQIPRSMGLAAIQDASAKVRWACVNDLRQWESGLTQALQIIDRNMDMESDPDVRAAKVEFMELLKRAREPSESQPAHRDDGASLPE